MIEFKPSNKPYDEQGSEQFIDKLERDIIYEDNHLLIVYKRPGILSQADGNLTSQDVVSLYKKYLKIKYDKPGNVYLGLVHRLDQPVAGLMILAKTSKAATRLSDMIRKREIVKDYLCLLHGDLSKHQEKRGLILLLSLFWLMINMKILLASS